MPELPHDRVADSTLAFLRDGYAFISNRCRRYRSDVFQTRLLLQPVICMRGAAAAEVFYSDRFERRGATPAVARRTLFGEGGVQGLDDAAHHHRKKMLMSLMTPAAIDDLADRFAARWRAAIGRWSAREEVVLYDEVARLLCETVCTWTGVPLTEEEVAQRTDDLVALFHPLGFPHLPYLSARRARRRTDAWIGKLVEQTRRGTLQPPEDSALQVVATHRDPSGRLLPAKVAAVEVINVLRPTVAITHFIAFAALALREHPEWRDRLADGSDAEVEWFVHEVRRTSPFFPAAAARVHNDFDWHGARFPGGRRVLLDLYGTNRHPDLWTDPDGFHPERFATWDGDPFTLIPQGGGDHHTGHRCAGEWITIRLMQTAVALLTREMTYTVPHQNLHVSLSQMPARPHSGVVIRDVRAAEARR
jgi:fatty-acid peroxygenase